MIRIYWITMASVVIAAAQAALIGLSCLSCLVVVLVLYDLYKKRHIFKFARNFKGYRFYPILGNSYHTIGKDAFRVIENIKEEFGIPSNLWNGHDYHYITADASEIKVVLNHPDAFEKGALYDTIRITFDETLILAKYDVWKRNRKIFARCFSQPILNGFVDVFYEKACTLADILKKGEKMDVYSLFERLSLDNFCANMMTLNVNAQTDINNKLTLVMNRLQLEVGKRTFELYFIPHYLYYLSPSGRAVFSDLSEMINCIYNVIKQKRQVFKIEKGFSENCNKLPLMDMMLETEGKNFSDEEISREIFMFLLAGTDTTGVTLAYTCTLLGMNPASQEKVFQEVKQVVGLDHPITHSDLPNLKYTERVLYESMRLLPVTPLLERYAESDIDVGDKKIPAGTNILLSIFNMHRSEAYWKNPLEFDPDRFLPEEVAERHPYAFIPFSGGPRNCIGMKYAMMMMKTTVAHVVRNFEIKSKYKSVTEMEFESFITMKTVDELDCKFIPRDH